VAKFNRVSDAPLVLNRDVQYAHRPPPHGYDILVGRRRCAPARGNLIPNWIDSSAVRKNRVLCPNSPRRSLAVYSPGQVSQRGGIIPSDSPSRFAEPLREQLLRHPVGVRLRHRSHRARWGVVYRGDRRPGPAVEPLEFAPSLVGQGISTLPHGVEFFPSPDFGHRRVVVKREGIGAGSGRERVDSVTRKRHEAPPLSQCASRAASRDEAGAVETARRQREAWIGRNSSVATREPTAP